MKQNTVSFRTDIFLHLGLCYLTGSKTDYRTFLIIVTLTSVHDVSTIGILQIKSIYPIINLEMFRPMRCLRQINDTHQRMPCFEPEKFVVLIYLIKFYNFFHNPFFDFF